MSATIETVKPETAPASAGVKPSLAGRDRDGLRAALIELGVPERDLKMRVAQLWHWIYFRGARDFDAMTNVAKEMRERLAACFSLDRPEVAIEQVSADGTRKWLIRLPADHPGEKEPTRSRPSISPRPGAARFASRRKSAARSPAPSAIPARSGWCATSPPKKSSRS